MLETTLLRQFSSTGRARSETCRKLSSPGLRETADPPYTLKMFFDFGLLGSSFSLIFAVFFSAPVFLPRFRSVFCDFRLMSELPNGSKIIRNHSRNALWFLTSFRNRFSLISAQFWSPPDLKNRAPVYTRALISKNHRFHSRTSFWNDFTSVFDPPNQKNGAENDPEKRAVF